MNIIQVVTQMESAGAQRIAYMLHQRFLEEGHKSELVFLYTKRPAYEGLPGVCSLLKHPPSTVEYIRIAAKLAVLFRYEKPDVLISHTHYSNILGQSIGLLCGIKKRIAVNHSRDSVYPATARLVDRLVGSSGVYTEIVAVSDSVGDSLAEYPAAYRQRITVINNGISVAAEDVGKTLIKERFGIPPSSPLLVNVGRLNKVKNQSLLIETLTFLPEAHLVIVGDGELRKDLLSLAESLHVERRLHLAGELPSITANTIVARCDVFLFPSTVEAMGLALAEAMLLSRPIVASDIPVFTHLLGEGGILAPVNDPEAWANSIRRILSDASLASALGSSAQCIAGKYTPEKMTNQYLSLMAN
jgi:glycosyltransferase involved in cell wall biosynthesis